MGSTTPAPAAEYRGDAAVLDRLRRFGRQEGNDRGVGDLKPAQQ